MTPENKTAAEAQYRTGERLQTRISIHEKYSTNRQGFGSWIAGHIRLRDGMRVLELGCGTGDLWAGQDRLIAGCSQLILSDLSEGMLRAARSKLAGIDGIEYRIIDIQRIPFARQSFDAVIANMVLHHVPDLPRALSEVRRVLKEGGTFYCATYGEHGITAFLCSLFGQYGVTDPADYSFTLRNGARQLSPFFADVQRHDYPDALEVTDLNDLADYLLSLPGMPELRRLPRETLLSVLRENTRNGILHVPKEYGLFICR